MLVASLFFTGSALANDQLFLNNGDRLSGDIISYNPASVSIKTAYGVFDVPTQTIGGITSPRYTKSDIIVAQPEVQEAAIMPVVEADDVAPETQITTSSTDDETGLWGAQWSGQANAGLEFKSGNSDTSAYSFDAKTTAKWEKLHRMTLSAEYDYEEDNDIETENKKSVMGEYDYFFAPKWFWSNSLALEQDEIEQLELRMQYVSALGYQFYDEDDLQLKISFGPGYEREEFENRDADDSMTASWALGYEQKFYDDFIRLFHNHDLSSPADDFGAYLFESETGVRVPLRKNIIATGEIEYDYDADAIQGTSKDDTTYRAKLGYEW